MSTPETEHQNRIRQLVEESDKQYEAELERQSKLVTEDDNDTVPIIKLPTIDDLKKS